MNNRLMYDVSSATSDIINNSLFCDGDKCLCWIIVLLNILAVFYLVFCSFYRASRLTRLIGWVLGGVLLCGTIAVVAIHSCLFTLFCAIFSVMIFMAVLSVVLPEQLTKKAEKSIGSYVIKQNEKGFTFSLYDASRRLLVSSLSSFETVAEAKHAIKICKENGLFALIEDNTEEWQKQLAHPKYEIFQKNKSFYFRLVIDANTILFVSEGYSSVKACKYYLDKVIKAVGTEDIYILADIQNSFHQQNEAEHSDDKNQENILSNDDNVSTSTVTDSILADRHGIVFNESKDLKTLYTELSEENKILFDRIKQFVSNLEKVTVYESKTKITFKVKRNQLSVLRIKKGIVEVVLNVADFIQGNDVKTMDTQVILSVIKVKNEEDYNFVISTIAKKYLLTQKR